MKAAVHQAWFAVAGLTQGIPVTAVTLLVSSPSTVTNARIPSIAGCRSGHRNCWQFALVEAANKRFLKLSW